MNFAKWGIGLAEMRNENVPAPTPLTQLLESGKA